MNLEAVIGLEIHVQLKTKSKMFCHCSNASEGAAPNTLICPICTGHPGTLPIPNRQAIRWTVMAARALGCTVPEHAKFDRKHYFYPDLPKGYQISQYDEPIGVHGSVELSVGGQERSIGITRLHLEEDVGKLFHEAQQTLVDYNRAGTPLMEIVTEPDVQTPVEAKAFLHELRLVMRYLGVSNADMEKGELRCDANISLRPVGSTELNPKTEVKNLNSFRSVERALGFELERQRTLWESGQQPRTQHTRGWDEAQQQTFEQRTKEGAADYRFFPEPDIPPLHFTPEFITEIEAETPELPGAMRRRFEEQYGFTRDDASALIADKEIAAFTEHVVSEFKGWFQSRHKNRGDELWHERKGRYVKLVASWLLNRLMRALDDARTTLPTSRVSAQRFAEFLILLDDGSLNSSTGQIVLKEMIATGNDPHVIVEMKGLGQVGDVAALTPIIESILREHADIVQHYRDGKVAALQFLIGSVMRHTKGRANPTVVRELILRLLRT